MKFYKALEIQILAICFILIWNYSYMTICYETTTVAHSSFEGSDFCIQLAN